MQFKTQTQGFSSVTEVRTTVVVLEETELEVEVEVVVAVVLRETEVEAEVGIETNALMLETVQGVVGSESAAEYARTLQAAHTRMEDALQVVVEEEDKRKLVEK